ncbi:hypothetical protein COX68_03655 [Candidatus Falkowbacteria bacterium CG_4_10_14_0_2_um_filter_41_15]|uniref:Uncharacterized protein n=1 Tax=Candidatus Falkowbacteria bacterium CG_4_10_14_0_2_um_filter_41_15 TaxID=1974554 RepID=A0A2M7VX20_9BACT|nr:MAG: hypothetical protein COX68_03655 [Candidatus Falkowbacteria bacterium CG_4_10_14_0_2_um_filter_41_15]
MKNLRKFFAVSVMALTIFTMTGISPVKASAQAGDLIKKDGLSTVYYLGADGKRYVFPHESVYFSWYKDFSSVVTVSATELSSYPLAANVVMRAGTKLVKIISDPSVYAVEANGVLRKIQSESDAIALYGALWAKRVIDVADSFFTNYVIGTPLTSGQTPAGSLVKVAGDPAVYYFDGTSYRNIANEAAFNANRFDFANVITISAIGTVGAAITGAESALIKPAQTVSTGPVITGSSLMVSLSSATPIGTSIPNNGARIPFTKVNLSAANDGAITVSSITVKRIGLSSYSNIDQVWAEKAGVIVAAKKSMNSSDESILTFVSALTVPAGETVTLDIIASLKNSGSGNIGLGIASAAMVSATSATVTGSFPVNGNLMSLTSYQVVNLYLSSTSTAAITVKVGDEKVELAKVGLDFNTYNNGVAKDVTLKSIMLKNNGVEDLSTAAMNLYLEYNGAKVSESTVVNGRFVTFNFPAAGFDMLKDDGAKTFYVKGDIVSKQNTATNSFNFVLYKSTDIVAYEKSTGFGGNVYLTSSSNTSADAAVISNVVIDAGAFSVSKKVTSPSDTTIIKGSDNVILLANVRADEAMTADGLNLLYGSTLTNAATVDQFENVRVYVNGVLLDSFDPAATSSSLISKAINSTVSLNKGDNEIKVMVKAKSSAAASSAFMAKLDSTIFTGMNGEYVSSGNAIAAPSGTATGAIFTVQGATLTTVRSDGYANGKIIVRGATDVSLGKFTVKATNDNVTITSIALGANLGTTSATSISDMKIFVDGVQKGSTVDFGSTGATFSSLNVPLAKDATMIIELKGSFDSAAAAAATGFGTVMTINSQDSRGTSITSGNTATTAIFAIATQGTLDFVINGDTPAAGLLATNASEHEVAQFKLTAINDSANLTEVTLGNYASGTLATTTDPRIASVRLYSAGLLVDSFVPVNGVGTFTITNDKIVVAANTNKIISVKVVLNDINNDASSTDKHLLVRVTDYKFKSSAGSLTDSGTVAVNANNFLIRKTIPTVDLLALPDTTLNAGNKVVSKFTVHADANGDVTLNSVVLTYSTTTNAGLATLAANSVKVNGVTKTASSTVANTGTGVGTITLALGTDEVISAGTTKTFEILATVSVSGSGSESITTKISEPATYLAADIFKWSDGASISVPTWSNGHRVPGLETNTQVISK